MHDLPCGTLLNRFVTSGDCELVTQDGSQLSVQSGGATSKATVGYVGM